MKKNLTNIAVCSLMIAGGGLAITSCKGDGNAQQQQNAPALATMTVSESDADLNTNYPATLHGKNDVEIRPQISGFLTKVHVQEGQKVSAGQLLFTIDQVQLQAAVDAAKAAVEHISRESSCTSVYFLRRRINSSTSFSSCLTALSFASSCSTSSDRVFCSA